MIKIAENYEKITVMYMDEPVMNIDISGKNIKSTYIKETINSDIALYDLHPDRITYKSFMEWLEFRLPDSTRDDIGYILKKYSIPEFEPYQMCKKSHAVKIQDYFWLKWENEQVSFNDIRLR